jgi:putative ABC transport system permease protein
MFKSYLTSTLRDILKNKGYSSINIIGLAVALAACLLITLFVDDELGYDDFIPNADNKYRIEVIARSGNQLDEPYSHFMGAYAPMIKERSSDVLDSTRYETSQVAVGTDDKFFYENVTFADPNFLEFMGFDAPAGVLDDQQAIVINRTTANKYFAGEDAVGKTLTLNKENDYRVAYVMPDMPRKSHMAIEMIAPYHQVRQEGVNREFMSMNNATYVELRDGLSPDFLTGLIATLIDENVQPGNAGTKASSFREPVFVAVGDVYLKSPAGTIGKASGDINIVVGFISVAVLIVIIATVNYINLATARAMKRAREVGIRKVMGATKSQLITQFLGESLVITIISSLIAIVFVELTLPIFNDALGRDIMFDLFANPLNFIVLLLISVFIGLVAGLYPAFYLSSFNPAAVLKSEKGNSSSIFLRQFLVFLQFSIAITLIAGTTVIVRQTIYANSMDPGYEKEGVLLIRNLRQNGLLDQVEMLDQQLSTIDGVTHVTASQFVPTDPYDFTTGMFLPGKRNDGFGMSILSHQPDFFETYQLQLAAGRGLDESIPLDKVEEIDRDGDATVQTNAFLNRSSARFMGWVDPEDAINKQIVWSLGETSFLEFTIVGVIEDVHLRSIHNPVRPMLYFNFPDFYRTLSIRFATDDYASLIADLEKKWADIAPGVPLGYQILSERVDNFYASENRQVKVFVTFAFIAIIISAVGLLGLTAFSAERRTKEIGIRKVLGARTIDIVKLMLGQFSKLVLLANLLALPVAWWLMDGWLSSFEYRIDLNAIWFIGAGLAALIIAWATVISYSIKAAKANPVDSLRYE